MSQYNITLTPVDKFFFGGDMTFAVDGKEDHFTSYIIQSMMFPQQTSILGMLRFLLLRNAGEDIFADNKIVVTAKERVKSIIGENSFSVNPNHQRNDFGAIRNISAVCLLRKDEKGIHNLWTKLDYSLDKISFDNVEGYFGFDKKDIPSLPCYNAKDGLKLLYTDGTNTYKSDEIFIEDRRIGVNRDIRSGKTDDNALFKQISYRFSDNAKYCFAFDAEIDDSISFESYNGQMVSLGGDNSQFIIGISKATPITKNNGSIKNAIVITSPTYLTKEEAIKARFAISRLTPFRFLSSNLNIDSYHIKDQKLKRSTKYELYAPGSIFFFANEEDKQMFAKMIDGKQEFKQIGYNEYQQ